jgi:hypothetical protein
MKFLVAHTLYFGPVVLVALLGWRAVGRTIGEFGPAPVLLLALALVLSLDSESRHLVNLVPLVVPFVAKAVDEQRPSTKAVAGFAVWSLLVSKAWLVIGSDTSLYFLTEGPWMTHAQYAVQGALLLLVAAWLARSGIVPGQPWRASAASPYAGQRP